MIPVQMLLVYAEYTPTLDVSYALLGYVMLRKN